MIRTSSTKAIVDQFFGAYSKHDINGIREVMAEDVTWYFLGDHPYAGVKKGVNEVVGFFDVMAGLMAKAKTEMHKIIVSENEDHFIECQRSSSVREDGLSLEHYSCVLWTIAHGKIVEGRHFFSDQKAVDRYFTAVASK